MNSRRVLYGLLYALISSAFAETVLHNLSRENSAFVATGRVSLCFLALFAIYYCSSLFLSNFKEDLRNLVSFTLITVGTCCLIGLGCFLANSIVLYQGHKIALGAIRVESLYLAIPFASGALILQTILGIHYTLAFSWALTVLMGLFAPADIILAPYAFVTSIVASISLQRFRSRSAYLRAAFNITLVAIAFAFASLFLNENLTLGDAVFRIGGAALGVALCIFIAAGITPLFEYLGGYVTDMRLIEMATLDHPLLKELSIQAPGTWNHSMVMGMMAEQAADAVGANPTIARVGAYFHDIGKIKKPIYFVENQSHGENRHDKLSPSMSALIIRSHVKDGLELGKQHRLPQVILDVIPQHHGTSLIEYFHDKAVKDSEAEGVLPDKNLYSYPGPRPQTKEAGILMLADGIEAAARTLSEPNPDRIQGLVQKMINKVFRSGELDECELTLKELHLIAKCFTRVLTGIYHQRIAYAEPAEKINIVNTKEEVPVNEETNSEKGSSAVEEDDEKEDLRRLGQDHE
ncbi:MAG: HDIG domain-containing protein [SAR324 cluster bacterium]|uniref:HDIG domain-containing protein n=1 Tax=SAR324 cluster bacterium TaxID=2024889 RepID=A0A7X9FV94_9DELT|nr:HDIG domain-containing protein [SAR324 cluster bacterium]